MKNVDLGPIFIGGPDRCGKTTLQAFLTSHSRIAIPDVGSNMWTYFYGQYGDLGRPENFEACLAAMLSYKHVLFLNPDPGRIRAEFWAGEPTYGRLFALFHQHFAARVGKPRWGVQTGLIERYADRVFAAYPGAKMIHMIRDPRDRYQASLALWPNGRGRAGGASARWLYSMRLARRSRRRYPGQVHIVQYERLVRETEATLQEVCAFIGEDYEPAMLAMGGAPERRARLTRGREVDPTASPLSTEHIGLFRQRVPPAEIAFMQGILKKELAALGYTLEPISLSPAQRLRLRLIDWPLNLARLGGWLAVEFLQQHDPARFGRRPDPRMIVEAEPAGAADRPAGTLDQTTIS